MSDRHCALLTSLRLRGAPLIAATFIGVGGLSLLAGDRRIPVPAALFGGGIAVPYLLLGPVLPAISITLSQEFGSCWFEVEQKQPAAFLNYRRVLLVTAGIFSFLPALLTGAPISLALVYLRNLVILLAIGKTVTIFSDRPQACLAILLCTLMILTFGWDIQSNPYPWAVLAAPPDSTYAMIAAIAALLAIWFRHRFSYLRPRRR